MPKRTDQEIRAAYAAKIAKLDAREAHRSARKASKDVRTLERDLALVQRLHDRYAPLDYIKDVVVEIQDALKTARAAALATPAKGDVSPRLAQFEDGEGAP